MFGNFTEEARKILIGAKKEMHELKHPYVGSEHLLLSILHHDENIASKLKDYGLDYKLLKDEIIKIIGVGSNPSSWFLYTPLLKRILESAVIDSRENNGGEVTVAHLFSSLLEEGEGVAVRIMLGMNIDLDELYNDFSYKLVNTKSKKKKKLLLEELGVDLTKKAMNNELDPVVGRDKEIKRVLEVLSRRTKNNPLLIGEAGVGKTAIVEELSRLIVSGNVPLNLKNKRVIALDMASAVAGTKYRGEFEDRMRKILKEIEDNPDIILFIDEVHTLVGAGGAEGAIDASNIFKPALARNKLRCIGATTISEYKKFIEPDSALERRFQKIMIDVPNKATVKEILYRIKSIYERYHLVSVDDDIINTIIDLSEKYIYDRNQPDKAIDVLDEVCAKVSLKESKDLKHYNDLNKELQEVIRLKNKCIVDNKFDDASNYKRKENILMDEINNLELRLYKKDNVKKVTKEDVASVINMKTKIPVYEILNDDKKIIKNIEKNLKNKIIGQKNAINQVLDIAKRIKLGFREENKCYSMMFCGPSGVGKTELSKLFGENLVGKNNVIRLDMSEYAEGHAISKFIGAPPGYVGYADNRNVLEEIRNKPYSVLILDEIEKAHPSIINLLFQILDEGKIKDSLSKEIRFDNVTIIMTSNLGFNDINIGFVNDNNEVVMSKLKENFNIAFVNRIDNVVVFNTLNSDNIEELVKIKLKNLKDRYKLKDITVKYSKNIINDIVKKSNYEEFGARQLDKIIKDSIENYVIDSILNGDSEIEVTKLLEHSPV
ncbi:MAG: ATP-dependent Clp protease ATP-binding subunit [Bacilli bacterium]